MLSFQKILSKNFFGFFFYQIVSYIDNIRYFYT